MYLFYLLVSIFVFVEARLNLDWKEYHYKYIVYGSDKDGLKPYKEAKKACISKNGQLAIMSSPESTKHAIKDLLLQVPFDQKLSYYVDLNIIGRRRIWFDNIPYVAKFGFPVTGRMSSSKTCQALVQKQNYFFVLHNQSCNKSIGYVCQESTDLDTETDSGGSLVVAVVMIWMVFISCYFYLYCTTSESYRSNRKKIIPHQNPKFLTVPDKPKPKLPKRATKEQKVYEDKDYYESDSLVENA